MKKHFIICAIAIWSAILFGESQPSRRPKEQPAPFLSGGIALGIPLYLAPTNPISFFSSHHGLAIEGGIFSEPMTASVGGTYFKKNQVFGFHFSADENKEFKLSLGAAFKARRAQIGVIFDDVARTHRQINLGLGFHFGPLWWSFSAIDLTRGFSGLSTGIAMVSRVLGVAVDLKKDLPFFSETFWLDATIRAQIDDVTTELGWLTQVFARTQKSFPHFGLSYTWDSGTLGLVYQPYVKEIGNREFGAFFKLVLKPGKT